MRIGKNGHDYIIAVISETVQSFKRYVYENNYSKVDFWRVNYPDDVRGVIFNEIIVVHPLRDYRRQQFLEKLIKERLREYQILKDYRKAEAYLRSFTKQDERIEYDKFLIESFQFEDFLNLSAFSFLREKIKKGYTTFTRTREIEKLDEEYKAISDEIFICPDPKDETYTIEMWNDLESMAKQLTGTKISRQERFEWFKISYGFEMYKKGRHLIVEKSGDDFICEGTIIENK